MKKLVVLVVIVLGLIGYLGWTWDGTSPAIKWKSSPVIGKKAKIDVDVTDTGRGLRSVQVSIRQGKDEKTVLTREYPKLSWPWQKGQPGDRFTIVVEDLLKTAALQQGDFEILVKAVDQANLLAFDHTTEAKTNLRYDSRPPQLAVLSQQHYIRQGGCEAILYRISPDAKASGVLVGQNSFVGYPVPGGPADSRVCVFALSYDQSVDTPMFIWAEDQAGNRAQINFWKKVFPTAFRKRDMPITDTFMQAVVPEILAHTDEVTEKPTLIESYLEINRKLRKSNNDQISALGRASAPQRLWSKPFIQLTNSQVEAVFADRRTYFYNGKQIDQQTHLGFDLATSAQNPVESANDGTVVYADYFGIYGNCVIVDHGLGLQSLYGHLSSIEVEKGQKVTAGQTLGRTGQTGLAGGDHLHFSLILQGIQVNPVEWWDAKWVELHILGKLAGKTS
ncbi:MAG: M23 family metallopeptidase [Acidobacteria bacterium]|nr:MAG: M23 family metallopeptidase [Acidobacteriota bacterium]